MDDPARVGATGGGGDLRAVLVVEDNPEMRALIRALLAGLFPTVHECDDAASALDLYRRHRPDWVLMDIGLPGSDGVAATRAIRDLDPDARVIMVTDYDDHAHRAAAARAGARGYLLKQNLLDLPGMLVGP